MNVNVIMRILIFIVAGCVWGRSCDKLLHKKGYTQSWFIWGFLFHMLALFVVLCMPVKEVEVIYNEGPSWVKDRKRLITSAG